MLMLVKRLADSFKSHRLNTKPDPKEYLAILGKGSVVPCQIEAYFLALNKYIAEEDQVLDVGFGLVTV